MPAVKIAQGKAKSDQIRGNDAENEVQRRFQPLLLS